MHSPLTSSLASTSIRPRGRLRLAPGVGYALTLALAMRVALSAMAAWLLSLRTPRETAVIHAQYLGQTPLHDLILAPWQRFDAFWYTRIAVHGYGAHDGSTVYFPLYPLLIKIVAAPLGGNAMLAALVVSNLCFAGLLVALYRLVAPRHGEAAARRTVGLLCLFPTAFFLLGAYTEALFLLLAVSFFLALDRKQWLLAGALGFLAALTRVQGIVLVLPLLWVALHELHLRYRARRPDAGVWHTPLPVPTAAGVCHTPLPLPWLAAALPPLGSALFLLYVRLAVHGGFITSTFKSHWYMTLNPPWVTLASFWTALMAHHWHIFSYPTGNWVDAMNLILALGVLALALPARRVLGTPLWLYALATWIVTLSLHQSTARYMLTVFPAFIVLAVWARGRRVMRLALLLGAPLMLFAAAEFVSWSFVG